MNHSHVREVTVLEVVLLPPLMSKVKMVVKMSSRIVIRDQD